MNPNSVSNFFWCIYITLIFICVASYTYAETSIETSPIFTVDTRLFTSETVSTDFSVDTRYGIFLTETESDFFTIDTRLSGSSGIGKSGLFTVDTRNVQSPETLAHVSGEVFNQATGALLTGVQAQLRQDGILIRRQTTDTLGRFEFSNLIPGTYSVQAVFEGFLTDTVSQLSLVSGMVQSLEFYLQPRPQSPSNALTFEAIPKSIIEYMQFTPEADTTLDKELDSSLMTIVLTHGWIFPSSNKSNNGTAGWPSILEDALSENSARQANIVLWDWRNDATSPLPNIALLKTIIQGSALGKYLLGELDPSYSEEIHFIGHSLGTIVNATAVNYLHANGWSPKNTHMTLFDQAEVTKLLNVPLDYLSGNLFKSLKSYSVFPNSSRWTDSYATLVAIPSLLINRNKAVKIWLTDPLPTALFHLIRTHGYPTEWYFETITDPEIADIGFRYSWEMNALNNPPELGTIYIQSVTDNFKFNRFGRDIDLQEIAKTYAGAFLPRGYEFIDRNVLMPVKRVAGVILIKGKNTVKWIQAEIQSTAETFWTLGATIRSRVSGLFNARGQILPDDEGSYVVIPMLIPEDAGAMALDFSFAGGNSGNLVVAIGETVLFFFDSGDVQRDAVISSSFIDITQWSGQKVDLLIGLVENTDDSTSTSVQGIRFYPFLPPPLQIRHSADGLILEWPITAKGFVLEHAPVLSGLFEWNPVDAEMAVIDRFQTVTLSNEEESGFYRLRRLPLPSELSPSR